MIDLVKTNFGVSVNLIKPPEYMLATSVWNTGLKTKQLCTSVRSPSHIFYCLGKAA